MKRLFTTVTTFLLLFTAGTAFADKDVHSEHFPSQSFGSISEFIRWKALRSQRLAADRDFFAKMAWPPELECTQTNYDVLFHQIDLIVDDSNQTIEGHVLTQARAAEPGVSEIQINLTAQLDVDSVVSPAGPLGFTREQDVMILALADTLALDDIFEYEVHYHGHPAGSTYSLGYHTYDAGLAFQTRTDGKPCISTMSQPHGAGSWFPCKDRLDDKIDSVKLNVTCDYRMYVATQGILDSTTIPFPQTLPRTYHYTMPYPVVPSYLSLAISDYEVWYDEWVYNEGTDTMPIVNCAFPHYLQLSYDSLAIVPDALTKLSDLYGVYPYVETKYGHAAMMWPLPGAWENPSMVSFYGEHWWPLSEYVVVHEMAHQWWGTANGHASYGDVWLSEGWATYSDGLFEQYRYSARQWERYWAYMNELSLYDFTDPLYNYDTLRYETCYDSEVYYRGAWLCHMLRRVCGNDSVFFDAIRRYHAPPYGHRNYTTEEFGQVWSDITGLDILTFVEEWVYGTWGPTYSWTYLNLPDSNGGYNVVLAIDQIHTTSPQVFHMPVDFLFETATTVSDTTPIWITKRRHTFNLHLEEPLELVLIDPGGWIWGYSREINWKLHFLVPDQLPEARTGVPYEIEFNVHGGTGDNSFSLVSGQEPPGMLLDVSATPILSGIPSSPGDYTFTLRVEDNGSNYWDEQEYELTVVAFDLVPGDIDISGGQPDIADLVFLVAFMFQSGPPPPLLNLADVDGSCTQDIADLVYLVEFMFAGGPLPIMGCVD